MDKIKVVINRMGEETKSHFFKASLQFLADIVSSAQKEIKKLMNEVGETDGN